jgi:transmembrane protein DUF3566
MTRPENAEQTEVQAAPQELESVAEAPPQHDVAPPDVGSYPPAPGKVASGNATQQRSSSNGATTAPQQRQRATTGDGDPKTVMLQVGAPEHARGREPDDRQRAGARAYGYLPGVGPPVSDGVPRSTPPHADLSPPTVRVGGYTPPERVPPAVAGAGSTPSSTQARSVRVPRRTSLQLQRLEPWSVLKLSLVLSVAGFLVWMVAVGVLYGVLAGMGVWDQINGTYSDLTSVNNPQAQQNVELISGGRVFGVAMVIGLVNIVLLTALATVGSLVYNVAADLVGGVEVTLSEPE